MSNSLRPNAAAQPVKIRETGRTFNLSLFLFFITTVAFVLLAFAAYRTPYFDFDLTITRAVQSAQSPFLDALLRAVAFPGYPPQIYIEIVVLVVILWFVGARWTAVVALVSNLLIGTLGTGVKMLVDRPRPSPDLVYVQNPLLQGGGLSFPAGHVQGTVLALGFFMYLLWKKPRRTWWQNLLLAVFAALIVLVGISRVYVGEHWFSDVVGGYLFGVMSLWVTIQFYEWGKSRFFTQHENSRPTETSG